MAPAERPDPGTETIPVGSRDDAGDAEIVPTGMERPICGMQGQITTDESPSEVGGSPLS